MSILNALAAYGVQQKQSNEATKSASSTDATAKTSASAITEATVYTETKELKSEQTSDVYSKNGIEQEEATQEKASKQESTEAEQNQARLNNVSSRMTEEDMAMLQKEGFPIEEMTVEQLEAAMERMKLQKELQQGAIEHQVEQIQSDREVVIQQAIKMLAGNPKAEKIAEKLMKANIPVTKANLEKVAVAIEKVSTGVKLSPIECEYMVRNKLTPTSHLGSPKR